jgi:hypothetical protein
VPQLEPSTPEERRRFDAAKLRKQIRTDLEKNYAAAKAAIEALHPDGH